jgi:cytochrome c556
LPKPKKDYPTEEIGQISSLEELMRVQAQTIDPWFKKRDQKSFTDAEFNDAKAAGLRIQSSAKTVAGLGAGKKAGFVELATQLEAQATDFANGADAKDPAKVTGALVAMKATCMSCHKAHR